MPKGSLLALPAPERFYRINGTSAKESITVICSPTELHEVATLFRTTSVPQHNWTALEKELLEKSKMDFTQKADKLFQIVENMRSIHSDPFMDTLQVYSGQPFVVKKYDFQVQK